MSKGALVTEILIVLFILSIFVLLSVQLVSMAYRIDKTATSKVVAQELALGFLEDKRTQAKRDWTAFVYQTSDSFDARNPVPNFNGYYSNVQFGVVDSPATGTRIVAIKVFWRPTPTSQEKVVTLSSIVGN